VSGEMWTDTCGSRSSNPGRVLGGRSAGTGGGRDVSGLVTREGPPDSSE